MWVLVRGNDTSFRSPWFKNKGRKESKIKFKNISLKTFSTIQKNKLPNGFLSAGTLVISCFLDLFIFTTLSSAYKALYPLINQALDNLYICPWFHSFICWTLYTISKGQCSGRDDEK